MWAANTDFGDAGDTHQRHSGLAHHRNNHGAIITSVTKGAANITGIDFGFNFDTIVSIRDSSQDLCASSSRMPTRWRRRHSGAGGSDRRAGDLNIMIPHALPCRARISVMPIS